MQGTIDPSLITEWLIITNSVCTPTGFPLEESKHSQRLSQNSGLSIQ